MTTERNLYQRIVAVIKRIPRGKVATYGQIAAHAGNSRAARQVAYALHSSWSKEDLPWHRVINSRGTISLKRGHGYEVQRELLEAEGIVFEADDSIDLKHFLWRP